MINKLNLSSNPFRNRTIPYVFGSLLFIAAIAGAIFGYAEYNNAKTLNAALKVNVETMQAELNVLKEKELSLQKELTPDQQALMIASHKLVASKSFSWSRLFADVEAVIPGSVSTSRISVQNIYKDGDRIKAELELSVLSRDYQSVMVMIANMNNSGIFKAELRGQDLQKTERITYSEFSLHVIYSPHTYVQTPSATSDLAKNGGAE